MEDPESFSTHQETNENNNIDFTNVLNGSVLSSLSKSLDLALLDEPVSAHLDDQLARSASCCDPVTRPAPAADNVRAAAATLIASGTKEQLREPKDSLLQEESISKLSVSSSNCDGKSNASLILSVNSHHEASANETKETPNESTSLSGAQFGHRDVPSRPGSATPDDGSDGFLPDITDTGRSSASTSFSTSLSEKLSPDTADSELASTSTPCSSELLQTSASLFPISENLVPAINDSECSSAPNKSPSTLSSQKHLPETADAEQLLDSAISTPSQKPSSGLVDIGQISTTAGSSTALSTESPLAEVSKASLSRAASTSSGSTSSVFPRSSSSLSGTNSFSFPVEANDLESSGDSTDYEDAFDWDLSGNIEYCDFEDRGKVKLKQSVPRELDPAGATRLDFSAESSLMETSSPLQRKRAHDKEGTDQQSGSPSRTGLRSGKRFKSSEIGRLDAPGCSTPSSQPNVSTQSSTVNGGSTSFDWILSSSTSSTSASSISVSKAPSTSSSNAPSTSAGVFKAPSLTTRSCKPTLGSGSVTSRLTNRTPSSSNTRVTINTKPSSSSNDNTALQPPTVKRGRPASSPITSSVPDAVCAQPNRARLRKVLLEVMGKHKRSRLAKAETFAASRKELLGDILKQLHTLQAQCVEGRI